MGKSWKERPSKWKSNKDFQKKQKQKNKHNKPFHFDDQTDCETYPDSFVPDNDDGYEKQ